MRLVWVSNVTAPGQTAKAELPWTLGSLARHDEKGNTVLYPGTYTLTFDEPALAKMTLTLTGTEAILDKWPAAPAQK